MTPATCSCAVDLPDVMQSIHKQLQPEITSSRGQRVQVNNFHLLRAFEGAGYPRIDTDWGDDARLYKLDSKKATAVKARNVGQFKFALDPAAHEREQQAARERKAKREQREKQQPAATAGPAAAGNSRADGPLQQKIIGYLTDYVDPEQPHSGALAAPPPGRHPRRHGPGQRRPSRRPAPPHHALARPPGAGQRPAVHGPAGRRLQQTAAGSRRGRRPPVPGRLPRYRLGRTGATPQPATAWPSPPCRA
ncbi:MAG: hypothetical protein U5P41_07355 [Gammaproteobacteria bacterium]|nr:hypothetical protein [Gammaproteobacteria bacterium]